MTSETATTYEGRWRRLVNTAAERKGSIHDDEAARKLGFRGGFVPGSTVATAALPAVMHAFGPRWMEGGWYSFNFVSPVYIDEEVRELGEPAGDGLSARVVSREGRLCCNGRAGLGFSLPWDPAADGTHGAEGVLPGVEIGHDFGEMMFTPGPDNVRAMLASAGEDSRWYTDASPWGGAVVPPEHLHGAALRLTREAEEDRRPPRVTGVQQPGMWAQHDLAVAAPLPLGETYRMTERIADKGRSGRSVYLTYEFEVFRGDARVAIGRHKIKWLAAPEDAATN